MKNNKTVPFTVTALSKVEVPAGKTTVRVSDQGHKDSVSGLYLKVGKTKAVFYIQKRIRGVEGNAKTFFVGNLEFMNVETARREARQIAALCDQGKDPNEEKKTAKGLTLKKAWEDYKAIKSTLRESTLAIYKSQYKTHLTQIEDMDMADITPRILVKLFLEAKSQYTCQKALILFNNIWRTNANIHLKNGQSLLGESPYEKMKELIGDAWNEIEQRDVAVIQLDDIGKYVAYLEYMADNTTWEGKPQQFRAYQLCLFTGLRYHEAATLQWSAINWKRRTLTVLREYSKRKREHIVYLSTYMIDFLKKAQKSAPVVSNYVFPMLDGSGHITKRTALFREIEDHVLGYYYTSHANRRSFFCFAMVQCNIAFPIVQKMLNHKSKGNSVAEKHYFLLEKFNPGALKDEFQLVSDELIKLRDEWLSKHGHTLCLPDEPVKIHMLNVEAVEEQEETTTQAA